MHRKIATTLSLAAVLSACSANDPPSNVEQIDSNLGQFDIVVMPSIGSTRPSRAPSTQGLAALAPAAAAGAAAPITGNGIDYHGGPIMPGTVNLYYIWYGNWGGKSAPAILSDWGNALSGSAIYGINSSYSDNTGSSVSGRTHLAQTTSVGLTHGANLVDADVWSIVNDALNAGSLPSDPNGVYFVLTSADVNETGGFCTSYCGWHTARSRNGTNIKFAFIGDGARCNGSCGSAPSPNGDSSADGMASIVFHELSEAVSDPLINAWTDSKGQENGDLCAWQFGSTYRTGNGGTANVRLGNRDYLLQEMWLNAQGGSCRTSANATRVFNGGDSNAATPVDWDPGFWKGDCGAGNAIAGVSQTTNQTGAHALLCAPQGSSSGNLVATLDATHGDSRRANRLGDWDFGYVKAECGVNEYVSGLSMNTGDKSLHEVRCASGSPTGGGQNGCSTHSVTQDDRGNTATGDWDSGYYKGECAAGQSVYGISVAGGKPHKILCCDD